MSWKQVSFVKQYAVILGSLLLLSSAQSWSAGLGKMEAFPGYKYLTFADPLIIRYADQSETRITVTAMATVNKDFLALVVNDRVVAQSALDAGGRRTTLIYDDQGTAIKAVCVALMSDDDITYIHHCSVYAGDTKIGKLELNKRIYPGKFTISEESN